MHQIESENIYDFQTQNLQMHSCFIWLASKLVSESCKVHCQCYISIVPCSSENLALSGSSKVGLICIINSHNVFFWPRKLSHFESESKELGTPSLVWSKEVRLKKYQFYALLAFCTIGPMSSQFLATTFIALNTPLLRVKQFF